jgi:NAD(P)-dependent dehydrogenase (short-subunit alcohol dehydrogenase family)
MKSLIMTGADGALGQVVAKQLLSEGWNIFASAFNTKSFQLLKELFPSEFDNTLFATVCDLSEPAQVASLVTSTQNVNGLVHLAGGYRGAQTIAEHADDDFDFLMDLNAKPTFYLLRAVVPLLKQNNGGSIVTIGAKPVIHPAKGNALYTASKSAVAAMTLSVAEECRAYHVRANCILPATLQTPNNLSWATEEQFKKFTPLRDVADTISFLMSDAGKGITGMLLPMYNEIGA